MIYTGRIGSAISRYGHHPDMVGRLPTRLALGGLLLGASWAFAATPLTILMEHSAPYYRPPMMIVEDGIPIMWKNATASPHSVTSDGCTNNGPCLFDSGVVPPEARYRIDGLPAGRYPYHCRLHPVMRGLLIVGDSIDEAAGRRDK